MTGSIISTQILRMNAPDLLSDLDLANDELVYLLNLLPK